jgi:dolichol-phosphate mannosyltransferase
MVVDGQSSDGTGKIAQALGATVIRQRRSGYGDALRTGFHYVMKNRIAKTIVMMDGDSTYDAKDIPKLLRPILSDKADMVVGNRFPLMIAGVMTRKNRIGNRLISWVARKTLYLDVHDTQSGLRGFRTELLQCMPLSGEGMQFATEMIVEAVELKARVAEVNVSYRPRYGESKLSPIRDGFHILGTIIRLVRDSQPLLFFGGIAAISAGLGLLFGVDVMLEWFATGTVRKIPSLLIGSLLFVSAIQFFALGLVADMIKRMRLLQPKRDKNGFG